MKSEMLLLYAIVIAILGLGCGEKSQSFLGPETKQGGTINIGLPRLLNGFTSDVDQIVGKAGEKFPVATKVKYLNGEQVFLSPTRWESTDKDIAYWDGSNVVIGSKYGVAITVRLFYKENNLEEMAKITANNPEPDEPTGPAWTEEISPEIYLQSQGEMKDVSLHNPACNDSLQLDLKYFNDPITGLLFKDANGNSHAVTVPFFGSGIRRWITIFVGKLPANMDIRVIHNGGAGSLKVYGFRGKK